MRHFKITVLLSFPVEPKMRSEILTIRKRVPQGSVLTPLLYLVYISDVEIGKIIMFADNTSLIVRKIVNNKLL